MGQSVSKFFKSIFEKKEVHILMLGLDYAGKTTILYQLKLRQTVATVPTPGFNVEIVEYKNFKFNIWDMGSSKSIRLQCKPYYQNSQGLIFVVDSSDRERIELAREELQNMLELEEFRDVAILIFANKQDLEDVMSVAEVTDMLGLHSCHQKDWYVQGASAITGDGLYEGLDWLTKTLNKRK